MSPISKPGFSASVTSGPLTPGTAEDYELRFARRALKKLKDRLGADTIEKLLQPDIDLSREWWRETLAENITGEFKPCKVQLAIEGISMEEFTFWFRNVCQKDASSMLAAQPEHYVVISDEAGNEKVIENIGEHITRFYIKFGPPTKPWQLQEIDDDFPFKLSGYSVTDDGDIRGYVLHQFRARGDGSGFDVKLCTYYPSNAPEELFEQHRQHLVVEFTNWTKQCYHSLRGSE